MLCYRKDSEKGCLRVLRLGSVGWRGGGEDTGAPDGKGDFGKAGFLRWGEEQPVQIWGEKGNLLVSQIAFDLTWKTP